MQAAVSSDSTEESNRLLDSTSVWKESDQTKCSNCCVRVCRCGKMATAEPPPSFVSDSKSYAEYKADLEMWSRITSLDPKVQAEMVVYRLEGDPSRIKEKIVTFDGLMP